VISGARRAAAIALALAAPLAGCARQPPAFHGTTWDPPSPAPEIRLTDQHGEPFVLAEHRGQVVLVFFGFTFCPDVCPTTLSTWARVRRALGPDASRVEFVFVTVDPERDDARRLAEHLAIFDDAIVGLTGTPGELQPVWDAFHIYHERREVDGGAGGYLVDHTSRVFVIDPAGRIRMTEDFNAPPDDVVDDVRALLEGA